MQGGNAYGGGGYGYGYDAGANVYDTGAYGSAGGYYYSNGYDPASAAPAYVDDPLATAGRSAHGFPAPPPLDCVELQPSEACPKNYVIFDQARAGSSVTFHPTLAHKLVGGSSSYDDGCYGAVPGAYGDGGGCSPAREKEGEDSEEIDALLQSSSEDDDDDVASTGRAPGCGGSSPESSACSSAAAAGGRPRKKKERIKRMVRALKGVVPGGKQMDTPAVLDEAVWYLKSLKLEATNKKLGARGSSDT